MGLIKAAFSAVGSTLHDQWKDATMCEDMGNNVLMVKKTTVNQVITTGSRIIVAPGQLAVLYDQGKILDATAEPGNYSYDSGTSPSFFNGEFKGVFKEMFERFTYGGGVAKDQAVFFFNVKEILDNKFGTPHPVPYKDWGHPIINPRTNGYIPMRVEVKCFGKYTFRIVDPVLFMTQIAGKAEVVTKDMVVEQMRAEVIGAFSNVMNGLGEEPYKIEVMSLPNKTGEIKDIMDEKVFDKSIRDRGISLVSFVIESLTLDEESSKKIDQYEIGGDAYQQKGVLTDAYGKAVQEAASNPNGAMNGFVGVGMMNMAGGGVFGNLNANTQPNQPMPQQPVQSGSWTCAKCGVQSTGKFCTDCGAPKPEAVKCAKCGAVVIGKFCGECGEKVSQKTVCLKCGTVNESGKFCADCGAKLE